MTGDQLAQAARREAAAFCGHAIGDTSIRSRAEQRAADEAALVAALRRLVRQ